MTTTVENSVETETAPQPVSKKIGIPKETYPGECRVAATPDNAKKLEAIIGKYAANN